MYVVAGSEMPVLEELVFYREKILEKVADDRRRCGNRFLHLSPAGK
jgi:hypothetical protein